MKNLLYLLFAIVLFSCSNSEDSNTEDTNPVYLDDNGKTVRAKDWAKIGDSGLINGVLYTIVTRDFLTVENDLTRVCTSRITTMDNLFKDKSNFNQDIGSWDVSKVTNMEYIFKDNSTFNQSISNWDVSNVTTIWSMFYNATAFNQPIGSWDVSKVTDMTYMFNGANSFNQNLSQWCVVNIRILSNNNNSGNFGFNGSTLSSNNRPIWRARAASCP